MYKAQAPHGGDVSIPESRDDDCAYFTPSQIDEAIEYYNENGYVVIRGCVDKALCERARKSFLEHVKSYDGFIYRQTGGNPERHRNNERGFLMNPILNIQDLRTSELGEFRANGLDVICSANVKSFLESLYGEAAKVVQTMYFEGNSATWAHQDTYYLDSENIGAMVGAWYAVEDIAPGAGRFFIYPKSHLIDLAKNGGEFDVAFNHGRYKKLVVEVIRNHDLECKAPALEQGDVLFWNSKTIHGSLGTSQPDRSRSSFTAHFIPESDRFLQFQARIKPLEIKTYKGWKIHHPKSLDTFKNRAILFVETRFQKTFQFLKWSAVKILVTK